MNLFRLARVAPVVMLGLLPSAARGQDGAPPPSRPWTWSVDANLFAGYNYQQRRFADFTAWESQNWVMGAGERPAGRGRLRVQSMLSFEPFTVPRGGSPQLFQTGETYHGVPLVNLQHPHDLLMALGGSYRLLGRGTAFEIGADLVGPATLGPAAFMHRESARNNPQAPLTHHVLDSTHISAGVVRAGIESGGWTAEASLFRGAESDEIRTNIERPALDSWAARLGYRRGPWSVQFSGGVLHEPEWWEPYDHERLTASIQYGGAIRGRRLDALLAWGQERTAVVVNGVSDGFLLEWDLRAMPSVGVYGRAEVAMKQLFGLGLHPKGFEHPHVYAHVDALTLGGVRDLVSSRWSRIGIGADVTLYHMSPDVLPYYGGSRSFHLFLRWRPGANSPGHVH